MDVIVKLIFVINFNMKIFKFTIKILIILFNILSCCYVINLPAETKIIYYCETQKAKHIKYSKRGYSDRPCDVQMFDPILSNQTVLVLEYYKKNYSIHNYENKRIITQKQQACNKILERINEHVNLLKSKKHNKILAKKLKSKLSNYKKLQQERCIITD